MESNYNVLESVYIFPDVNTNDNQQVYLSKTSNIKTGKQSNDKNTSILFPSYSFTS